SAVRGAIPIESARTMLRRAGPNSRDNEIFAEDIGSRGYTERAQLPPDDTPREDQRCDTQGRATGHECDHDDVPQRTIVVQPWKIEGVQAVIRPAAHPVASAVAADNARGLWIDVIPRPFLVVETRE